MCQKVKNKFTWMIKDFYPKLGICIGGSNLLSKINFITNILKFKF